MKLSPQDISDFLKLFIYGIGSRLFGFFIVFLLARQLSLDDFAWWQISKTAASYVLIIMEAGFFFHVTLLIQRDGFSAASVRSQIYKHRLKLGLLSLPVFFIYLAFTDVPSWYALLFVPFFFISVADYDGIAVASGQSVAAGLARLLKNALILFLIATGAIYSFSALPILATTIGTVAAAFCLHRTAEISAHYQKGKTYADSLWNSLRESRHYFTMQVTQTLMQSADLIIAGLFISNTDVAHYSIALLIAEFALFPSYMAQRVIQAKYIRNPNPYFSTKVAGLASTGIIAAGIIHYLYLQPIYGWLFPKLDQAVLHGLVNVLLSYVAVRIPNTFIQLHFNATDRGKLVSAATTIGTIANVTGNLILIPKVGIVAIPWVTVAAEILILFSLVIQQRERKL